MRSEEIETSEVLPDAELIPSGFKPKSGDNTENNQMENCLIFVLHFCVPSYIYTNYCFVLKEKDISEYEKLEMRFNDLYKENQTLKTELNTITNTSRTQQQQISQLLESVNTLSQTTDTMLQRIQELETTVEGKTRIHEIGLNLENNWVPWDDGAWIPKARKIGNVVYLRGLVKNGTSNTITTLPEGWRPSKYQMFCTYSDRATRVDVYSDGRVYQVTAWGTHISLAGITFIVP